MEQVKPTLEQLKAFAYDCIARKESAERDLKMANEAIANFKPEVKKEEVKEEVKEVEEEPIKE